MSCGGEGTGSRASGAQRANSSLTHTCWAAGRLASLGLPCLSAVKPGLLGDVGGPFRRQIPVAGFRGAPTGWYWSSWPGPASPV